MMRRITLTIICLVLAPILPGCTVSDAVFAVLGHHYTGGGYTPLEKKRHYDRQVEASRSLGPADAQDRSANLWAP